MRCLICQSSTSILLYRVGNSALRQCDRCGFIAADVPAGSVDFEELYADRYPPAAFLPQRPRKLRKAHAELRVVEQRTQGRRLLDVGCSYGFFLDAARQRGWQVLGVDVSYSAATFARTRYGLVVLAGTLAQAGLAPGSFDLVSIRHVLEHVPDPLALLEEARRLLAPGGILLVAVPNIDSLAYRLVGRDWWWIDPPTHLWYFSPRTLTALLARSQLIPLRTQTSRADDHTLLYTLLFALNRRTRLVQRLRGAVARRGSPLQQAGPGSATATARVARSQARWGVVNAMGEVLEAVLRPAVRLADRAGLGSEVLIFARATPSEVCHGLHGAATGGMRRGATRETLEA